METKIATNPEQSARLVACGVDPKSADMYLSVNLCKGENYGKFSTHILGNNYLSIEEIIKKRDYSPAWSLSALLALLPKEITDESGDNYYLSIAQEFPLSDEYGVSYKPCWSDGDAITRTRDNCPIEACVLMIEWLTANSYKLNNNG